MTKSKERPVIITTEFRGVFFGFATNTDGDVVVLRKARNCIFWHSSIGGFMGLAATGPNSNCKIGAQVDQIELRKVTAVIECSDAATKAWEAAPAVGK